MASPQRADRRGRLEARLSPRAKSASGMGALMCRSGHGARVVCGAGCREPREPAWSEEGTKSR
eukprot:2138642-Alexandrium_andersonii.AAC.1